MTHWKYMITKIYYYKRTPQHLNHNMLHCHNTEHKSYFHQLANPECPITGQHQIYAVTGHHQLGYYLFPCRTHTQKTAWPLNRYSAKSGVVTTLGWRLAQDSVTKWESSLEDVQTSTAQRLPRHLKMEGHSHVTLGQTGTPLMRTAPIKAKEKKLSSTQVQCSHFTHSPVTAVVTTGSQTRLNLVLLIAC